jgi:hypothetical protein
MAVPLSSLATIWARIWAFQNSKLKLTGEECSHSKRRLEACLFGNRFILQAGVGTFFTSKFELGILKRKKKIKNQTLTNSQTILSAHIVAKLDSGTAIRSGDLDNDVEGLGFLSG